MWYWNRNHFAHYVELAETQRYQPEPSEVYEIACLDEPTEEQEYGSIETEENVTWL